MDGSGVSSGVIFLVTPAGLEECRALNAAYREALKHAKKDRPVLSAEESAYKAADEFYVTIGPRAHRVDLYM